MVEKDEEGRGKREDGRWKMEDGRKGVDVIDVTTSYEVG